MVQCMQAGKEVQKEDQDGLPFPVSDVNLSVQGLALPD